MKKYTYVTLETTTFLNFEIDGHREIIDQYAKMGYRYVGFIPINFSGHGVIRQIDLIFETDVNDNEE